MANAPTVLAAIDRVFPAKRGSYLFGLMVQLQWGVPTLIEVNLGLIVELGARNRFVVLGRITAILPRMDNDLLRLNLDAIGIFDFDQGTAEIDALLAQTRRQGYGVRDPRHASIDASSARAVSAIAVPVLGRDRVIACLNCVWLSEVATEAQIVERYLGTLRDAAADIARREERPARGVVASSGRAGMVRTNLGSASSRRT